eukprot:Lankesteria_metandrocarpae@DN5006_c0_g1_i3.p1
MKSAQRGVSKGRESAGSNNTSNQQHESSSTTNSSLAAALVGGSNSNTGGNGGGTPNAQTGSSTTSATTGAAISAAPHLASSSTTAAGTTSGGSRRPSVSSRSYIHLQVGDLVWADSNLATVKYVSPYAALKPDALIGVEFIRSDVGNSDGTHEGTRLFKCDSSKGGVHPVSDVERLRPTAVPSIITIQKFVRGYIARRLAGERATYQLWTALEYQREKETLRQGRDVTSQAADLLEKQMIEEESNNLIVHRKSTDQTPLSSNKLTSVAEESDGEESSSVASTDRLPVNPQSSYEAPTALEAYGRRRSSLFSQRRMSRRRSSISLGPHGFSRGIDDRYKGPRLKFPVQRSFCLDLIDYFRENPNHPLPADYAMDLLLAAEKLINETTPGGVFYLDFPKRADSRIIVVGDTHGQLNDVLWIFYKFGPPSPINIYLFNGDIADRGVHAVEIFMLLFAFKLAHPESIVINRGNHESVDLNEVYGFATEVRSKYNGKIFCKFQDIFHLLPLCIVLENRIAVVHGGLFRKDDVTLEMINSINRKRPCPVSPRTVEDTLMFDILWSDPQHEPGRGLSTRGADCISFGGDVTANFLVRNGLEVCIRSHQVPVNLRGFEPLHEGYCVTLFSASNYCGTTGNLGGVIIFEPDMAFEIQEYMAPSLEDIKSLHYETREATKKVRSSAESLKDLEKRASVQTRRSSVLNLQRDVIQKIGRLVCHRKPELWEAFRKKDHDNTAYVTAGDWLCVCSEILGDNLPWMLVQKHLKLIETSRRKDVCVKAEVTSTKDTDKSTVKSPTVKVKASNAEDSLICYGRFLNRFRVEFKPSETHRENWRKEVVQQIFESILQANLSLRETLMVFDRNCDGTVSYREFYEFLNELNLGMSDPQVRLLMRVITSNHAASNDLASRIDAAEFLGRFSVVYRSSVSQRELSEVWMKPAVEEIGRLLLSDKKELASRHYGAQQPNVAGYDGSTRRRSSAIRAVAVFERFKEYNEHGGGFLSFNDFVSAILKLPGLSQAETKLGRRNVQFYMRGDPTSEGLGDPNSLSSGSESIRVLGCG